MNSTNSPRSGPHPQIPAGAIPLSSPPNKNYQVGYHTLVKMLARKRKLFTTITIKPDDLLAGGDVDSQALIPKSPPWSPRLMQGPAPRTAHTVLEEWHAQGLSYLVPEPDDMTPYKDTNFTEVEANHLYKSIANTLPPEVEKISFKHFKILMRPVHVSRYYMMGRVFSLFDQDKDGFISIDEYIKGLSVLLRGNLDDQIDLAFSVYDEKERDFLDEADVIKCLQESSVPIHCRTTTTSKGGNGVPDLQVQVQGLGQNQTQLASELCDLIFPKLDTDKDGKISFEDFQSACRKDPTLVECLGPVLPQMCEGHNAHRVVPGPTPYRRGTSANMDRNEKILTETSLMSKLCNPDHIFGNTSSAGAPKLLPIPVKNMRKIKREN